MSNSAAQSEQSAPSQNLVTENGKPHHADFPKLIGLFTDKHSCDLYTRQASSLKQTCKDSSAGIFLGDLEYVGNIIHISAQRIREQSGAHCLYEPLLELVKVCGLQPFHQEKASDLISCQPSFSNFIDLLLTLATEEIALGHFDLASQAIKNVLLYLQSHPNHYREIVLQCVKNSHAVQLAVSLLTAIKSDFHQTDLLSSSKLLLSVLKELSYFKPLILQMVQAEFLPLAIGLLNVQMVDFEVSSVLLEILWNMFELFKKSIRLNLDVAGLLNSVKEFHSRISNYTNTYDIDDSGAKSLNQLFNESIVILSLVATHANQKDLSAFDTSGMLASLVPVLKETKTTNDEEFERIQLVLHLLFTLSSTPQTLQEMTKVDDNVCFLIFQNGYLDILIQFANPNGEILRNWKANQQNSLRLQALSSLFHIFTTDSSEDQYIRDFISAGGVDTLLHWITIPIPVKAPTASVPSTAASRITNREPTTTDQVNLPQSLRQEALATLLAVSKLGKEIYERTKLVEILIGRAAVILLTLAELTSDPSVTEEVMVDLLSILSQLCSQAEDCRKTFSQRNGLHVVFPFLQQFKEKKRKSKSEQVVTSAIDLIWTASETTDNIDMFVQLEGVDLLLDILDDEPPLPLQNQILRCLTDLTAREKTPMLQALKIWQSEKSDWKLVKLLVSLWFKEEHRLGVGSENGLIEDLKRPLNKTHKNKAVQGEVDMRASIYTLFALIGFQNIDDKALTAADKGKIKLVTCVLSFLTQQIEQYVTFKVSETWGEIAAEMEEEFLLPVSGDKKKINNILEKSKQKAAEVQQHQSKYLAEELEIALAEEKKVYDSINYHHKVKQRLQKQS